MTTRRHPSILRGWLWPLFLRCFRSFTEQDTSLRCAGTAFFGVLSLFPGIATAVLIFGLFADRAQLADVLEAFRYIVPAQVLDLARQQLSALIAQPPVTLGIGLLISVPLSLWSGSRGVDSLLYAMSRVRRQKERRGFIKATVMAVTLTLAGGVFFLVALVTIAGLPALIPWPTGAAWLLLFVRWPVLLVLTLLTVMALYRWGPDRHPRCFHFIWPGALVASLLWIVAGLLFSTYAQNMADYQATCGSLSAAVVLMLWLYNSAQIFVLGAILNTELEIMQTGQPRPAGTPATGPDQQTSDASYGRP